MLNKVMLSTESRMRGDMQVRFGGRYGKTYCRKAVRRSVPSLRLGRGGNIIALAGVLYASDHVPYLLGKIAEQAPHIRPISFSFRQHFINDFAGHADDFCAWAAAVIRVCPRIRGGGFRLLLAP